MGWQAVGLLHFGSCIAGQVKAVNSINVKVMHVSMNDRMILIRISRDPSHGSCLHGSSVLMYAD